MSARKRFEEWCGLTITDPAKAPKATALKNAYWNAWQAAWQAREAECEGLREALRGVLAKLKQTDTLGTYGYELDDCIAAAKFVAESALSGKREGK